MTAEPTARPIVVLMDSLGCDSSTIGHLWATRPETRLLPSCSVRKRNGLMIDSVRGRRPDIAVIDRPATRREDRQPGICTVPRMVVEIASGNWSTDLVEKQEEYEALGVPEYWIVDYRGEIPAKYCLRGKGKKVIVLTLEDGAYRKAEYLEGETVPCLTFPELGLTVEQILAAEG